MHSNPTTKRLPPCPEELTFLELCRTADAVSRRLPDVLKAEDLSHNQYNVLRILRGSPGGLPCGEIGCRMLTRDPDITRLLDRLEKRGLIRRRRERCDRRMVVAQITPVGLEVLERLDEPVREAHRRNLGHLGREKLRNLNRLLLAVRTGKG